LGYPKKWLHNSKIYKDYKNSLSSLKVQKEEEIVKVISQLANLLSNENKKAVAEKLVGTVKEEKVTLPISIFRTKLSALGAIVVYLKEIKKLKVKEIATLLNRELSTIYTTFESAKNKLKISKSSKKELEKEIDVSDNSILIPLSVFSNRKYAVLESLVSYLKDEKKFSLTEISQILNKSYSTIKTTNRRYHDKK